MDNPFKFGKVIGSTFFCNRLDEQKEVLRYIENKSKVFLYSERRFGKTSLVKLLLSQLDKTKFVYVYVDLLPTRTLAGFTDALGKAMASQFRSAGEKATDFAKTLFGASKALNVKIAADGSPIFSIDPKKLGAMDKAIAEILALPQRTAERTKKNSRRCSGRNTADNDLRVGCCRE